MEYVDLYFYLKCDGIGNGISYESIVFTDAYHDNQHGYMMIIESNIGKNLKLFLTASVEIRPLIETFEKFIDDPTSTTYKREFTDGNLIVQYAVLGEPFRSGISITLNKISTNEQRSVFLDKLHLIKIVKKLKESL